MFKEISIRSRHLISLILIAIVVFLFSNGIYESYRWNNINYVDVSTLERFTYAADSLAQLTRPLDDLVSLSQKDGMFVENSESGELEISDDKVFSLLESLKTNLMDGVQVLFFERGSRYVYTTEGKIRYNEYEKSMLETYYLAMSQFYLHLCRETTYSLIPIMKSDYTSGAIARIIPLSMGDKGLPCSLIFLLPQQLIQEELGRYMGSVNGDFYIYNQHYTVLYSSLSQEEAYVPFQRLARLKGSGVQILDQNYVTLSVSKADAGLHFILCTSQQNFYASVQQSIHRFAWQTLLLGLLLVVLFLWQIYFSYMPVRRLASELTGHARQKSDPDELMMIKNSYNNTVEEVEKLSGQVSELAPLAVQHFLSRWILGRIPNQETFNKLASYADVYLPYQCFVVLYFSCDGDASPQQGKNALLPILNRFHSSNKIVLSGELVEESVLFMIVNYEEQPSDKNEVHAIGDAVLSFLHQNGFDAVRIGVGAPCVERLRIPESFREAGAAVQISHGAQSKIAYYDTVERPKTDTEPCSYDFPPMSVSLLIGSIGRADSRMAKHALSEIMEYIRKESVSIMYFRFYGSNLLKLMLDEAERNHIQYLQADLHFLIAANSPQEFDENIYAFVDKLCGQVLARQALSDRNMRDRLMTNILEHYKEFRMSIQFVSEASEVPCAEITRIIKDEVGLNFVQYVSYLRMNEFKRLLIETDRTISELVCEIGYSDVSNFLRKFKNAEGMTAGQYREKYATRKGQR